MKNWFLVPALLVAFTTTHAADLPPQGMSMAKVQKNYGVPLSKRKAVGRPPITRWNYADYTVTFEYKHVVQSVRIVKGDAPAVNNDATAPNATPAANEATLNVEVQQ